MAQFKKRLHLVEAVKFGGLIGNGVTAKHHEKSIRYYIMTRQGEKQVKLGDWIITETDGYKSHCTPEEFAKAYEPIEDGNATVEIDGNNCIRCGQSIAKRKVTFASALASALIKAYFRASEKESQTIIISDLQLNHAEYTRINDLVRFGLLYKDGNMVHGEYGVPRKRVAEFLNNKWPVAAWFFRNPITEENEMSQERIFFRDVPSVPELVEKYGDKLTEYVHNDIDMVS